MGIEERKEMLFWTKAEYQQFADAMMDKPISYYAFQMLFWCGIRLGELLALTPADFDFERSIVTISKSYQRLKGRDVITTPKTKKSNRNIHMPEFICQEMQDYIRMFYGAKKDDRIFPISKHYLHHEMGVKRIRIHDIRHAKFKATTQNFCRSLEFLILKLFILPFYQSSQITGDLLHLDRLCKSSKRHPLRAKFK